MRFVAMALLLRGHNLVHPPLARFLVLSAAVVRQKLSEMYAANEDCLSLGSVLAATCQLEPVAVLATSSVEKH